MIEQLRTLLPYVGAATAAGVGGALVGLVWRPSIHSRSAIQHFAAGLVIAAVASEVIPEVETTGTPAGILLGFAAGGAVMIALKWAVVRFERRESERKQMPIGLSAAAALDTFIDGAITATGFSAAAHVGALLAIALSVELFFLTLSVGSGYPRRRRGALVGAGIALLFPVGAVAAAALFHDAHPATLAILLSFGAAALVYLVAEELLVEAIEAEESLFSTAMLFCGFLVVVALRVYG